MRAFEGLCPLHHRMEALELGVVEDVQLPHIHSVTIAFPRAAVTVFSGQASRSTTRRVRPH